MVGNLYNSFLLILSAVAAALAHSAPSSRLQVEAFPYAVSSDTAWVDHARPILTTEAMRELVELWKKRSFKGACLIGEVQQRPGLGKIAYVTAASSAAFLSRCTGFRYIGAVMFTDAATLANPESTASACELLKGHPSWGVAGTISGVTKQTLRDPQGRVIGRTLAPEAQFCGWLRNEEQAQPVATATATA